MSERQSFSSRTPENSNPDRVTYRRGFVTRHQVTGWRFVMRRIASGVAMHDTRMLVDPLRSQSRAVLMGVLLLITGVLGCFVFSFIRPSGAAGNDAVLADRDTAALYIRVNDELHPVLNLTSARLIAGQPVNPTQVKSAELDRFPRGGLIGIPGAPERMVQAREQGASWTVCQGNDSVAPGVTVIAGAPAQGGERAGTLAEDRAVLVDTGSGTWLLWGGRRSPIDLADRAVTGALGFGANIPAPRPISSGLFNAIPEGVALRAPQIAGAGEWAQFPLPVGAPVGSVIVAYGADNTMLYYAVLPDGLQQISPVLAALLRNTDSYGLQQPPRLGADEIAALPVSQMLDADAYPDRQLDLVDAQSSPVTCASWAKPADASTSSLTLLSGAALPVSEATSTVELVNGGTATRVAIPAGSGYLVQTVGSEPTAPPAGALFWVSDTGVRYGLEGDGDLSKTVAALGLNEPATPIPWSVLSLLTPGPALSRDGALTAYTSASGLETTR
ncbi:type VII secretion protein EccB [Mycolicibacterium mengxianglii]|uniref:type VII secretion protein EccB n=1 Tax=Mycolicibacterium mengxianglii TaxID=2736649 RepID=UPI0018EEDD81|nr:type VII secretion protein EccB [Mycolicibacterium mengxianglii]